ncbi:hypothetical protein DFH08DRAFT_828294 [Mycena albidolilacea]|uniref:Uncharacterized protein n=1 Tax=Mycena albidolilacea TaxID=1033008 RepID=A0AAD6YXB4_9AGAR|nr:hypothetical protein DFH08DRAFT_828294 [Mycena albidolilacea]
MASHKASDGLELEYHRMPMTAEKPPDFSDHTGCGKLPTWSREEHVGICSPIKLSTVVVRKGFAVKSTVDDAIDRVDIVYNLRDADEVRTRADQATDDKEKRKHAQKGNYAVSFRLQFGLIRLTYSSAEPDTRQSFETIESFVKSQPVIKTFEKELFGDGFNSLRPLERADVTDGVAYPDEVNQIVVNRRVEGAPNFRQVPLTLPCSSLSPTSSTDSLKNGLRQCMPTVEGLRRALLKVDAGPTGKNKVFWNSIREAEKDILTPRDVFSFMKTEGLQDYSIFPLNVRRETMVESQFCSIELNQVSHKPATLSSTFNCQMGRGRTTTGMVAACLISTTTNWNGKEHKYDEDDLRGTCNSMDGEYKTIPQLVGVLYKIHFQASALKIPDFPSPSDKIPHPSCRGSDNTAIVLKILSNTSNTAQCLHYTLCRRYLCRLLDKPNSRFIPPGLSVTDLSALDFDPGLQCTPRDFSVGTETFFNDPDTFEYDVPPYRITDANIAPTPGRPLLTVHPDERGPSKIRIDVQSWPSLYFLAHLAIYRLLPFIRVPERINHTDPEYLASILDRAVPVFEHIQRTYVFIPRVKEQMMLLAGLLRLVSAVSQLIPARAHAGWAAFIPLSYPPLPVNWVFPATEEFPEDHPLRNPLSVDDHTTLLRIAHPALRFFTSFVAKGLATNPGGSELTVTLLDEAINPEYPIFEIISDEFRAGRLSPEFTHFFFNSTRALISYLPAEVRKPAWSLHILPEDSQYADRFLPHEDLSSEPYSLMDMATPDPIWKWWQRLQEEFALPAGETSPQSPTSSHAGTYSPRYRPTTPPSVSPAPNPETPPAQTGTSHSARKDPPTPRKASAIAASPSNSAEMQVDLPKVSSADALAIAEASNDLLPH